MIDLTDDMVELAQTITELDGRVYRAYPNVDANVDVPYIVINPTGRNPVSVNDDGSEMIVTLTYSIDIIGDSPITVDAIHTKLNVLYTSKGFIDTGYFPSFDGQTESYAATCSFMGTVDMRGGVHRG